MGEEANHGSISDATVPNAGRIYDYLLGGNHNFEVDRKAGEQLKKNFPEAVQDVRLIRWFLGAAVRRLCTEGYTKFLDFASGLPTVDHIHYLAPKGTKVVYSDIDPVTVSYGQEIVRGLEDVAYLHADAGAPEEVLGLDLVRRLIGPNNRIAVGFNGIAWFLPDEKVEHALRKIYEWVGAGSKLYVSAGARMHETQASSDIADFYQRVNQAIYPRTESTIRKLFGQWTVCDPGLLPLEQWTQIGATFSQGGALASSVTLVGAILVKEH